MREERTTFAARLSRCGCCRIQAFYFRVHLSSSPQLLQPYRSAGDYLIPRNLIQVKTASAVPNELLSPVLAVPNAIREQVNGDISQEPAPRKRAQAARVRRVLAALDLASLAAVSMGCFPHRSDGLRITMSVRQRLRRLEHLHSPTLWLVRVDYACRVLDDGSAGVQSWIGKRITASSLASAGSLLASIRWSSCGDN
jgi:hypothetical protein